MPRGGKRAGAGRPRKAIAARVRLEKLVHGNSTIVYGWVGEQLICCSSSGEYARYQITQLMKRFQMGIDAEEAILAMLPSVPPSGTAGSLTLTESTLTHAKSAAIAPPGEVEDEKKSSKLSIGQQYQQ